MKTTDDPTTGAISLKESLKKSDQSMFAGVSVRGWLAIILTLAVCVQALNDNEINERLYSLTLLALGFYFGQKQTKPKPE